MPWDIGSSGAQKVGTSNSSNFMDVVGNGWQDLINSFGHLSEQQAYDLNHNMMLEEQRFNANEAEKAYQRQLDYTKHYYKLVADSLDEAGLNRALVMGAQSPGSVNFQANSSAGAGASSGQSTRSSSMARSTATVLSALFKIIAKI